MKLWLQENNSYKRASASKKILPADNVETPCDVYVPSLTDKVFDVPAFVTN